MENQENTENQESQPLLPGQGGITGSLGQGKKYWKSLDELSQSSEYRQFVEREFPENASELLDPVSRRSFLGLMASSMALAGLTGCKAIRRPEDPILAYNNQPEHVLPGKPLFFASSLSVGPEVGGVLAESHQGRPTKIEGNPQHPANQGSAHRFHQASILQMYDPDRSQKPMFNNQASDWNSFMAALAPVMVSHMIGKGKGLVFVSEYLTSPTAHRLKQGILARFPEAKWITSESIPYAKEALGVESITGSRSVAQYQFQAALRIASFDCDFLGKEPQSLVYTRAYSRTRSPERGEISRLYIVESDHTLTGGRADHRLALKPSQIPLALAALTQKLLSTSGASVPAALSTQLLNALKKQASLLPPEHNSWIETLAQDLLAHKGQSVVCTGKYQDPQIHALGYLCNFILLALGKTVNYTKLASLEFNTVASNPFEPLEQLYTSIGNNQVETLIFINTNPVYTNPNQLKWQETLKKVKNTIHFGLYADETAQTAQWHLPASHAFESWTDALAYDGLYTLGQPVIMPLYDTRSTLEFLALWAGASVNRGFDLVRETLTLIPGLPFSETNWQKWIHDGFIPNTESPRQLLAPQATFAQVYTGTQAPQNTGIEVIFREDASVYDGRFANISWLQEFPDPMTRLTWDNTALVGPYTAKKWGVLDGYFLKDNKGVPLGKNEVPLIKIHHENREITLAVYVLPGLAPDTVVLNLGYGRSHAGKVGNNIGFDISGFQKLDTPYHLTQVQVNPTGQSYFIASVQEHWSLEGRDLARYHDINEHPHYHQHPKVGSLHAEWDYSKGMQWGMAIDLNKCTGCGHCVLACQAENNIPVVGKKQVSLNREMSWIRLDRYFVGDDINQPAVVHQPLGCQHCEMAPCENVCPVAATVHSSEGLNDMVYNRCIGTRYCSNNCPYKVRRFNFFNYTNQYSESEQMAQNPDVTVRFRGVMEKCSYCVQRINVARNEYKLKGIELIPDGAIVPACQQTCPAEAIAFGNINDHSSTVAKWRTDKRNYTILPETNARPRTSYLARLSHTNPALSNAQGTDHSHHGKS